VRWAVVATAAAAIAALSLGSSAEPLIARSALVAGVCLVLWLSEVVPPYVPTLVLWALVPLLLEPFGQEFRLARVLGWSADPVLALFLGGFTLSVAAGRYGIDTRLAHLAVSLSGGRRLVLLALTAAVTALMSMWMSNIAAAAMMLSALRPLLSGATAGDPFRRAMLMAIAVGANFGGMATPIGSGPNGLAIAAASRHTQITFLSWMAFAVPLTVGLVAAGLLLIAVRFRVRGAARSAIPHPQALAPGARGVMGVFFVTVAAWLSEPLHGAPSAVVALLAVVALFGSGLLDRADLGRIDWSTLGLIAGGIALGTLLEKSGLVKVAAEAIPWAQISPLGRLLALSFASALLSALMSNTAAATMLIPLAASIDPSPSTAVLIAIAASLGIPFVISTPPNAMVYGEGGLTQTDLLVPGLVLMILGCVLISLTGPYVLNLAGIP
jgi:sodium-dependent dicarboxylate transporter 2/3/5